MNGLPYREVWLADFEYTAPVGCPPAPLCVVARELCSGRLVRRWLDDSHMDRPPYPTGPEALFVAYYASAELSCHLALGWPLPVRVLDLYVEFRNVTNGLPVPCGNGLLGALAFYGLDAIDAAEKASMRQLAMRGGPYSDGERQDLLDYCGTDVDGLTRLLPRMLPDIDLPRAVYRGRYAAAVARMERNGVPIDAEALGLLQANWQGIKARLIDAVNGQCGVFVPTHQRQLNPDSRFGSEVLRLAAAWGLDPYELADAAEYLCTEERSIGAERRKAIAAARRRTGLTVNRIAKLEDSGKDHLCVPGLDTISRDLAGEYPALGIGRGYDPDAPDGDDNAARLWDVLREPDEPPKSRHHPDILRQAAEGIDPERSGKGRGQPVPMSFSAERFADYLARKGIPWPRLPSGALALDDDTFKEMARAYPREVGPIRDVRNALGQLRLNSLAVGPDGRNRTSLWAFQSRTGRNQPSNSQFIFGPSCWLRALIRPDPGRAVAYVDWSGQEYGIAAALSGDRTMREDYASGDPYLAFGKRIEAVPQGATKKTHGREREQLKTCCGLGAMYGAGPETLARTLCISQAQAREWLRAHRELYATYWRWSNAVVDAAMLTCRLWTCFGWTIQVGRDANPRSVRNFPMQAHGAEMMRLAACLATERGVTVRHCAEISYRIALDMPGGLRG